MVLCAMLHAVAFCTQHRQKDTIILPVHASVLLEAVQSLPQESTIDTIFNNMMKDNTWKEKHYKVLEGSQKRCENKVDPVCDLYRNTT